jgi:hypothetical protein
LGFGIKGWFGVNGLRFRVEGSGFRVYDSEFRAKN